MSSPAPPPPPPPAPPPPACAAAPLQPRPDPPKVLSGGGGSGRGALLADIQKGARLRKVSQVNDRSAPVVDKPKASNGDVSSGSSGGMTPLGPSLGGLFAGGFPTLRPIAQKDVGKSLVSCSSSSLTPRPVWNPPFSGESSTDPESLWPMERGGATHRPSSAPPSPSHASKHLPPPAPTSSPPPLPSSAPPPPPQQQPPAPFRDRHVSRPPPIPTCPPPPPPSQVTRPTWLPVQHYHHPSTPPPPPPLPAAPPSSVPNRSSGCFYPPPPSPVSCEPHRVPVWRDSPLGPPPPPPPPLPASFMPSCPTTPPPPPPPPPVLPMSVRLGVPPLPPSYPCTAPTRRPPAVPRNAGPLPPSCPAAFHPLLPRPYLPRALGMDTCTAWTTLNPSSSSTLLPIFPRLTSSSPFFVFTRANRTERALCRLASEHTYGEFEPQTPLLGPRPQQTASLDPRHSPESRLLTLNYDGSEMSL